MDENTRLPSRAGETPVAKLTVVHPDGRKEISFHDPSDRPTYEWLRDAVGGLIQPCGQFMEPEGEAYCNEEFLLLGMDPNPEGSRAVRWPVGEMDLLRGVEIGPLHGPVVILEGFDEWE